MRKEKGNALALPIIIMKTNPVLNFLKTNAMQSEVDTISIWSTVDIDFSYQGNPDETNFDVMNVLTSEGMHELDDLFYELCKESKIKNPIIESITIIASTPSYKQLLNA